MDFDGQDCRTADDLVAEINKLKDKNFPIIYGENGSGCGPCRLLSEITVISSKEESLQFWLEFFGDEEDAQHYADMLPSFVYIYSDRIALW